MYASIILFKKLGGFDDPLTYQVPAALSDAIQMGVGVSVPFGNRMVNGVVVALSPTLPSDVEASKIKPIAGLISEFRLPSVSIAVAHRLARYYHCSLAKALRLWIPKAVWDGNLSPPSTRFLTVADETIPVKGSKQLDVMDYVNRRDAGVTPTESDLKKAVPNALAPLKKLIEKGIIAADEQPEYERFGPSSYSWPSFDKTLTADQMTALKSIRSSDRPVLLHGVTGSGKTELYLRLIIEVVQSGKQAILLVPEIALTPQTVQYFRAFLGERVAVFHSKLSDGERAREWWKVQSGFAPLTIGSRSAIFAPYDSLGLIIIDEEHEWTYKQESTPYYSAHQVAQFLRNETRAQLVMGSATPSLERFHLAQTKELTLVSLPNRINESPVPTIQVIDLREEFKKRNFSIFSLALQQAIQKRLEQNEQIILFVNQRGLANAVVCRDCGYTEECDRCDISLKYHRVSSHIGLESRDRLICHYCGLIKPVPMTCPHCQSTYIKYVGVGTQRVEQDLKAMFPTARVLRADRDTTQQKGGFEAIYDDFLNHRADVLIGTQMIAKGLDFHQVTLIGAILADVGLHLPDFRSGERLFQLITQVAGRSGRGDKPGEVLLQTYNPDHPVIQHLKEGQYDVFAQQELEHRSHFNYPPFERLIKFTVVGTDSDALKSHIEAEEAVLSDIFKTHQLPFQIMSAPALIPKMADRFYYHVLIQSPNPNLIFDYWKPPKHWRVDVDPVHTT